MTEIPDRPFDKIAIDLVTDCKTSTSGNNHILTIIDHLTGWPEVFPIPDLCPQYIQSSRTASWTKSCNNWELIEFSLLHTTPKVTENWKSFTSI